MILPIVTPNNAHHNSGIEHMTQIEIRQSKYGPHRYSGNSDEIDAAISPSTTHHQGNDIDSEDNMSSTRKFSVTSHLRV